MRPITTLLLVFASLCSGNSLASTTSAAGGSNPGDTPFSANCSTPELMTGLRVYHNSHGVTGLKILCRQITGEGQWAGSQSASAIIPPAVKGKEVKNLVCPQNFAVSGFRALVDQTGDGERIRQLQLQCRPLASGAVKGFVDGYPQTTGWAGGSNAGVNSGTIECAEHLPARSIKLRFGSHYLNRFALDCERLTTFQNTTVGSSSVPTTISNYCKQHCGSANAFCIANCEGDYDLYQAYLGQMSTGVTMHALPAQYVEALNPFFPAVNLANWRFGFASSQPANNATTDCDKTYFNNASYVQDLRAGNLNGNSSAKPVSWLTHELWHYQQCISWGGRTNYAMRWWNELNATGQNTHTLDMWEFHDAMPMEAEASAQAGSVFDQLALCCLSEGLRINRPLVNRGISGPSAASPDRRGQLSFRLAGSAQGGPAPMQHRWRVRRPGGSGLVPATSSSISYIKGGDGSSIDVINPPDNGSYEFEYCLSYYDSFPPARSRCARHVVTVSGLN